MSRENWFLLQVISVVWLCRCGALPFAAQMGYGFVSDGFITSEELQARGSRRELLSPDYCFLEAETGPCRAYFERYFYNSSSKRCETFVYGGCRGNKNNFESKEECEAVCLEDSAPLGRDSKGGAEQPSPSVRSSFQPPQDMGMPPQEPEDPTPDVDPDLDSDQENASSGAPPSPSAQSSSAGDKGTAGNKDNAPAPQPEVQGPPTAPPPDNPVEPEDPDQSPNPQPPRSGASANTPFSIVWVPAIIVVLRSIL